MSGEAAKPADIPQDVWDVAGRRFLTNPARCICARAIMAERERCAQIAADRAAICADAVAKIEAGELYADIPHRLRQREQRSHGSAPHYAPDQWQPVCDPRAGAMTFLRCLLYTGTATDWVLIGALAAALGWPV